MAPFKRDEVRFNKARRAREALQLRLSGASYQEIADHLNISPSTAHGDVQKALHDIPRQEAEQLRQIEAHRLDRLQRAVWGLAVKGDMQAVDRALAIIEKRVRLYGLNAPAQLEVGSTDLDLDAAVRDLVAAAHELPEEEPAPMHPEDATDDE